ncbi:hypothetical protein HanRHA438_Chr09g0377121 [Helianthus annuus]|nr:hypothetical protein HanHA89_Chr09g0320781 [Helianthus annuus]KAJ0886245.1 hypothetical protein HanRHA438_Chr09g0377121 [Helianthus annuus]
MKTMVFLLLRSDGGSDGRQDDGVSFVEKWRWRQRLGFQCLLVQFRPNSVIVDILRARIVGLHHYLMLFVMLTFSVLFGSIEAPGLGIGGRYMFTMAIGRLLRALSFASTILPSPRPWCAACGFDVPQHHIVGHRNFMSRMLLTPML